ncbi:hypothetical protein M4I21_04985 [Cellulophaga sp. 20_2_10]|uniref:hypothetical protein n=1 Tax=Cellulophaga sp. 20_2_10 TaxID=2942476 RepID=UPI00201A5EBA|nr:hypothetical protein [Cellulophaga sp. 20_2_10]MCL5245152.1 hypothetical protein [Cellulophaga sp. 20_2_10]
MTNQNNYVDELTLMLEKSLKRMKLEQSDFIVFTVSIWTDRNANVSAINFDSKINSLQNSKESNEHNKKYYDKYVAEGDLEMAELFKQKESIRFLNPANFELSDFEEVKHNSVPPNWYSYLVKFGELAFDKIVSELKIDAENFELGINSTKDWYDKTWNIKAYKK